MKNNDSDTKHKMSVEHHHFLVLGLEISGVTGVGFIANRYKIGDALLILVVNAAHGQGRHVQSYQH